MPRISKDLQDWIDARNRFRLSHAHVQMARELGLNPTKLGKLNNHDQEQWKVPLPQFIERIYQRRVGKSRPDVVISIEERAGKLRQKKDARRKARAKLEKRASGTAWYSQKQWERLREISVDRDTLGASYEAWLARTGNAPTGKPGTGSEAPKIPVDVDELEAWCRSRGWVVNEKSRVRFVAYILRRRKAAGDGTSVGEVSLQHKDEVHLRDEGEFHALNEDELPY